MPVRKRRKRTLRLGLTSHKLVELLMGRQTNRAPGGYDGYEDVETGKLNLDAMRQDWERYRDQLTAFWQSGHYSTSDTLSDFGLDVRMKPWHFVCGSKSCPALGRARSSDLGRRRWAVR